MSSFTKSLITMPLPTYRFGFDAATAETYCRCSSQVCFTVLCTACEPLLNIIAWDPSETLGVEQRALVIVNGLLRSVNAAIERERSPV